MFGFRASLLTIIPVFIVAAGYEYISINTALPIMAGILVLDFRALFHSLWSWRGPFGRAL